MGLFAQHVCKRNLVRAENCVKCFQQKFLGPAYAVRKIANIRRVVNLFETIHCLYAGKEIR